MSQANMIGHPPVTIVATNPPTALTDERRKHLEMIQSIIARLAGNSFSVKAWGVAVASALLTLATTGKNSWAALIALLPATIFWLLDGYYLSLERRFRALFDAARSGTIPPFHLSPPTLPGAWLRACLAPSVWLVHASAFAIVAIVVVLLFRNTPGPPRPMEVRLLDTPTVRVAPTAVKGP